MKNVLIPTLLLVIGLVVFANAQKYELSKSEMKISGTSSIHDWVSEATVVRSSGNIAIDTDQSIDIKSLKVEIPVDKIKSPKGKIMENKTYDALKLSQHPAIVFDFTKIISKTKTTDGIKIVAEGNLKIAGVTKLRKIEVLAKVDNSGKLIFKGSHPISMKEFDMDPPTAMMGSIKTGENVVISFEVMMSPVSSVSASTK
jgi:polyisoprenoid-binding protein YceI